MIGDLLMLGDTQMMLDLWTINPWDYNKSGLYNLFDNIESLADKQNMVVEEYLKKNVCYLNPEDIRWYDLEKNWNKQKRCLISEFSKKHLWGNEQYSYYGGF